MAKRIIPKAMFQPFDGLTAAELLENEALKQLVKLETYNAIQEAYQNKKTFASLFQINTTGYYVDIPKQYWIPALEECIKYNLVDEKFEECIDIKKLIDKIKEPAKLATKKKSNGKRVSGDSAGSE